MCTPCGYKKVVGDMGGMVSFLSIFKSRQNALFNLMVLV